MIDSHCHLDHEPMFSDLKNVIIRSKENGLEKILSICTTNDSFKKIIEIIKFDPIIYGTFGIHPHETDFDKTTIFMDFMTFQEEWQNAVRRLKY